MQTSPSPAQHDALTGILVVDFTMVMAGPMCTRVLADLGADVIKIEPPEGDMVRHRPPFRAGISTYFASMNCGKRSTVLDLRTALGRQAAFDLASRADVVAENFRPGVRNVSGSTTRRWRASIRVSSTARFPGSARAARPRRRRHTRRSFRQRPATKTRMRAIKATSIDRRTAESSSRTSWARSMPRARYRRHCCNDTGRGAGNRSTCR